MYYFTIFTIIFTFFLLGFITFYCAKQNITNDNKNEKVKNVETFYEKPNNVCSTLLDVVKDDEDYNRLSRKVLRVKNDGDHFLGFHDKSPYNADYEYCFIDTFDDTRTNKNVPCKKTQDAYDYPFVNSVKTGSIMQDGSSTPRQVCIMEIDKSLVNSNDVLTMSDQIERHDNAHLMKTIDQYRERLEEMTKNKQDLSAENEEMMKNMEEAIQKSEECLEEKAKLREDKLKLQSEIDAMESKLVVIGDKDDPFLENIDESTPKLIMNLKSGKNNLDIPRNFNITYIYIPPNARVRLHRKNRSFTDYDRSTENYPSTRNIDVFNVERIQILTFE